MDVGAKAKLTSRICFSSCRAAVVGVVIVVLLTMYCMCVCVIVSNVNLYTKDHNCYSVSELIALHSTAFLLSSIWWTEKQSKTKFYKTAKFEEFKAWKIVESKNWHTEMHFGNCFVLFFLGGSIDEVGLPGNVSSIAWRCQQQKWKEKESKRWKWQNKKIIQTEGNIIWKWNQSSWNWQVTHTDSRRTYTQQQCQCIVDMRNDGTREKSLQLHIGHSAISKCILIEFFVIFNANGNAWDSRRVHLQCRNEIILPEMSGNVRIVRRCDFNCT